MAGDTQIAAIKEMVEDLLKEDPQCFLVDIWIKPTNNIKIALDADNGLSIEKCISLNRKLYKQLEEKALYPDGDFSLEVSSPGLDEPLKLHRQYSKNVGRSVLVTLNDGQVVDGTLTTVNQDAIEVSETKGKNKKREVIQHNIPFTHIKSTKIQIKF